MATIRAARMPEDASDLRGGFRLAELHLRQRRHVEKSEDSRMTMRVSPTSGRAWFSAGPLEAIVTKVQCVAEGEERSERTRRQKMSTADEQMRGGMRKSTRRRRE